MKPEDVIKKYNLDGKAKRVFREQRDVIKVDGAGQMRKTETGFLTGIAPVAKVGVMSYLMEDGTFLREWVPPETLFDPISMATLKMKPVTNHHPIEREVDSENASYEEVGYTGETVEQSDNYLTVNLTVTNGYVIENIEDGQQELSPGYRTELVFESGVTEDGQEYDAIQVSRKYNHVAVVDNARGGTDIRMKLDAAEVDPENYGIEKVNTDEKLTPKKETKIMKKVNIDGIEYDAAPEVANLVAKLQAKVDASEADKQKNVDALDAKTAEYDALKVKYDELEKKDNADEINAAVKERVSLVKLVDAVVEKASELKVDEMSNRELKVKVIDAKYPELAKAIDENTSDVRIDTLVDTVKVSLSEDEKKNLDSQRAVTTPKQDGLEVSNSDALEESRKKMVESTMNAWKREEK